MEHAIITSHVAALGVRPGELALTSVWSGDGNAGLNLPPGYGPMDRNDRAFIGGDGRSTDPQDGASNGGAGLYLSPTANDVSYTNLGQINGGDGGNDAAGAGGIGGAGVLIKTEHIVDLLNKGTIRAGHAGSGGPDKYGFDYGGIGGIGLYVMRDRSGMIRNEQGGIIIGGAGSYVDRGNGSTGTGGGAGLVSDTCTRIINDGEVIGGAGGFTRYLGRYIGGSGGIGMNIGLSLAGSVHQSGALTNTGTIMGGAGAPSNGTGASGAGGAGLSLAGFAFNAGLIAGGGGATTLYGGAGGAGGNGAILNAASRLLNTGMIEGGNGGGGAGGVYGSGTGGDGAVISGDGVLTNFGIIAGGGGGGTGVVISNGGMLINAGTIEGRLPDGGAVMFQGRGILVATPGAVFDGAVNADAAAGDVLELTGTCHAGLTGFGTQFKNFGTIAFAPFSARTIDGNQALLKTEITGFSAGDGIDMNFITFASADKLSVVKAGELSIITPAGTSNLAIASAMPGEMDFTLRKSADGILIGDSGHTKAMLFMTPNPEAKLPDDLFWAWPRQDLPAAVITTAFTTPSPTGGFLREVPHHFEMTMMPVITLHV